MPSESGFQHHYFECAEDSPIPSLLGACSRVATSDAGVLLVGEPGTGKEALARRIHEAGGREGRFISVACAGGSNQLMEVLFGIGSTGGGGAHAEAQKGTLYLDDVAEMPLSVQGELALRISRTKQALIAASTVELYAEVEVGRFRRDLYDTLACQLEIPPLRSRPADVVAVFRAVWAERGNGREVAPHALELLSAHPWRGNVRELEGCATRLAFLTNGDVVTGEDVAAVLSRRGEHTVSPSDAACRKPAGRSDQPARRDIPQVVNLPEMLARLEGAVIDWALETSGGNRKLAADLIGLQRTTLVEKLRRRVNVGVAKEAGPIAYG